MEEGFERPFVEKYRPETLEDVVGIALFFTLNLTFLGNKFAID